MFYEFFSNFSWLAFSNVERMPNLGIRCMFFSVNACLTFTGDQMLEFRYKYLIMSTNNHCTTSVVHRSKERMKN